MATVTAGNAVKGEGVLYMLGGTNTATTGDAALFSIQNINKPVLHYQIDDGETVDTVILFLRTDVTGVATNFRHNLSAA